jgi:transcriptional regulator with XRE-family HTH domain
MKTLSEFADILSDAKRSQKITAKELALQTGLSPLAVRQILSGTSAPKLTNAMALAQQLSLELVLVPKAVADGLRQPPAKLQRTVVTDLERRLGITPEGLRKTGA